MYKVIGLFFIFLSISCVSQRKTSSTTNQMDPKASAEAYQGLGKDSLSMVEIKKYAPPAVSAALLSRIQNMLDIRSPGSGMLHPDGKTLFFSWRVTGSSQIWKLDGPKTFPVQLTAGEDATSLEDITPDGKYLIISRDRSGEENPGLYLQSTEGGPLQVIQHKDKIQTHYQFTSSDSRFLYYTANDISPDSFALYKYDMNSKRSSLLFSEKGYWKVADFKDDGLMLLQKVVTNTASEFYTWSEKAKKLLPVLGQNELEDYAVMFGTKNDEYFVITNKFSDFKKLYRYQDKKWKQISADFPYDVSSFNIDFPRKHLLYEINQKGYTKVKAIDPKTLRHIDLPEIKDAEHVRVGSPSRNGKSVMLSVVTAQAPMVSYSYNWSNGKLLQWVLPSQPEALLSDFVPAQLEYYKSRDGVNIPYFVRRPQHCRKTEALCPVIVHFHGGPEGQTLPGFSVYRQLFVNEGFVFMEPNVRGSDGYGKNWLHSDNGIKRLDVITDIADAAEHVRRNWSHQGNSPKIGVMGGSYGGYATLMAMSRFSGSYDAGVSNVGISNLKTFLNNTAPYRRALRIPEYGDPIKDSEALDQLSPTTYIDQIKSPLLIIQGVSDPRVPVGEAVQMYEKIKAKGLSGKLIIFADEGHGAQKRFNQALEIGHTIEFFVKHLK